MFFLIDSLVLFGSVAVEQKIQAENEAAAKHDELTKLGKDVRAQLDKYREEADELSKELVRTAATDIKDLPEEIYLITVSPNQAHVFAAAGVQVGHSS